MKFIFTAISLILFMFVSNAQNLVSNPGFEKAIRKPEKKANSINRAKGWIAPTGNSDYYMKGAHRSVSTPRNVFGRQKPHSGIAYAGICARTRFLEYVETKLTTPLEKDREYLVEFYICRAERSFGAVKEFGVLFTSKKLYSQSANGITVQPQISFKHPKGYRNKRKWIKLSAVYKADGGESYITLGHFKGDASSRKRWLFCHYYIDDVSVSIIEITKDSVNTVQIPEDTLKTAQVFPAVKGQPTILKNIFFETNKSELLPSSFPELDQLATYLIEHTTTSIEISGHTDNTGNESQNKRLSEARAKAVAGYLSTKGINWNRITYTGYGSAHPIASNTSDEGKQRNRRVEFIINGKSD
ncbi:MAG: OmpA family protein [Sediminibacterium sp.]|nr:OmpA family protein [Sediminibacterium sp.]